VIFNVILFPFVWRAYDKGNPNPMIGLQGIAVDRLSPSGYVRINGELWRSKVIKDDSAIEKGEVVTVKGMRRLTLIVQSDKKLNT
jgi:membrane-bound ClpP family serine protease